jgi:PAS domain S-box-containing protein
MMIDDITTRPELKQKVLAEAKEFAEIIVETVRESLVVLDSTLKVISANPSFYQTFQVVPKETIGLFIYDLGNGQWNIPKLRTLLEEILPKKNTFENYEMDHTFETIGHKSMLLNARRLDDLHLILLAIEDVTEMKKAEIKSRTAEENIKKSEEKYRSLFTSSHDAIMTLEPPTWKFTSGNPATIAMFGVKNEKEFLSYDPWRLSPEYQPDGQKSSNKAKKMIDKAMKEGSNFFEWLHKRISGEEFLVDVMLSKIEMNKQIYLQSVVRDISERKKIEKIKEDALRLTASNILLQQVIETIPVRIFWKDKNLKFLGCNTIFAKDAGKISPEEMIGKTDYDMGWKNEADAYRKDDMLVMSTNAPKINYEEPQTNPEGKQIWLRTSKIPLKNERNEIIGILGTYEDITERKRVEKTIHDLSMRQKVILQSIPDILMEVNSDKEYVWANQPGFDFFGQDVLGQKADFYFEGEQTVYAKVQPIFQGSEDTVYVESWQRRVDGKNRLLAWWCRTLKDEKGNVTGALSSARDITEQREAEEKLRESEERFRNIFENGKVGIILTNIDQKFIRVNPAFCTLTGYSEKELLTKKFSDITHPDHRMQDVASIKKLVDGDIPTYKTEKRYKTKSGEIIWALLVVTVIKNKDGSFGYFLGMVEDITDRKRMEQNIIDDKLKDEAIIDSIGDAVFATDMEGKIILFNDIAEQLVGIAEKDALGKDYHDVVTFIKESDGKQGNDFISEAMTLDKVTKMVNHTILVSKDGRQIPILDSASPIKNSEGNIIGCVVAFHDITKERQIDKAKTEFVSLASHQLRTPLATINWYSELLLSKDGDKLTPKQRQYVDETYHASKRMVSLVNSLLNVSRLELGTFVIEPEPVDVEQFMKRCINDFHIPISQKHLIIKETYDTHIHTIQADKKLLSIIMQNLLSNAVKYTPEQGTVFLDVLEDKGAIVIRVKDTGIGIPQFQQGKIFSKLFRADNVHKIDSGGSGLGLYIVHEIVTASGGKIWFESKEGSGTTFFVSLPKTGMEKRSGQKQLV